MKALLKLFCCGLLMFSFGFTSDQGVTGALKATDGVGLVGLVQSSVLDRYPEYKVMEIFEAGFGNAKWTEVSTENKVRRVTFNGILSENLYMLIIETRLYLLIPVAQANATLEKVINDSKECKGDPETNPLCEPFLRDIAKQLNKYITPSVTKSLLNQYERLGMFLIDEIAENLPLEIGFAIKDGKVEVDSFMMGSKIYTISDLEQLLDIIYDDM